MSRQKVLVVEDDLHTRRIMEQILLRDSLLRHLDLDVVTAANGQEGLERFAETHPVLVITDLLMPHLDGFQLVAKLRADPAGKDIPILVTSAVMRDRKTLSTLEVTHHAKFIPKPFTPRAFAQQVRAMLATATPIETKPTDSAIPPRRISEPTKAAVPARPGGKAVPGARGPLSPVKSSAFPNSDGSLAEKPLPALLLQLADKNFSGTLELRHSGVRKVIYITAGHPIFVQSNLRGETLGQLLVKRGLITETQHDQITEHIKNNQGKYGEALAQLGIMSEQAVMAELVAQTALKIEACLRWHEGTWLVQNDPDIAQRVPNCTINPYTLVFGGLKRNHQHDISAQWLQQNAAWSARLRPTFEPYKDAYMGQFGHILIQALGETKTVAQLSQSFVVPEVALQMDVLIQCGLVELTPPKVTAPIPAPVVKYDLEAEFKGLTTSIDPQGSQSATSEFRAALSMPNAIANVSNTSWEVIGGSHTDVITARQRIASKYLSLHQQNHYEVLGLTTHSSIDEIQNAYQQTRQEYDLELFSNLDLGETYGHLEEIVARLEDAIHTLSDAARRSQYDQELARQSQTDTTTGALQAETKFHYGIEQLEQQNYTEATKAFNAACDQDRQADYLAYAALSEFLDSNQATSAAETAMMKLQEALMTQPDATAAHLVAARVCDLIGNVDEALQHLRTALSIDPALTVALDEAERLLRQAEQLTELEQLYRHLLHLLSNTNPGQSLLLWKRLLSLYHVDLMSPQHALLAAQAGLRIANDDPDLQAFIAANRQPVATPWPDEANQIRQTWQKSPDQTQPLTQLFDLHLAQHRHAAATAAAQAAKALGVQNDAQKQHLLQHARTNSALRPTRLPLNMDLSLRHPEELIDLTTVMQLLGPLMRQLQPINPRAELAGIHSWAISDDAIDAVTWAHALATLLSIDTVTLQVADLEKRSGIIVPTAPVTIVLNDALQPDDGLSAALQFCLAQKLWLIATDVGYATLRPNNRLRTFLLAALSAVQPKLVVPDPTGELAGIKQRISDQPTLCKLLSEPIGRIRDKIQRIDFDRWRWTMMRSADQFALALVGNIETAAASIASEFPQDRQALYDLINFGLSDTYYRCLVEHERQRPA